MIRSQHTISLIASLLLPLGMCVAQVANLTTNTPPIPDEGTLPNKRLIQTQLECLKAVTGDPENLGTVQANTLIYRRINFANTSPHTVRLKVVTTTCGCLSAKFSNDVVAPGASTTLTLSVMVAPAMGAQAQSTMFTASWDDASGPREQRGVCLIRYAADIDFDIFPDHYRFVTIDGEPVAGRVWARWSDAEATSLAFKQVTCTLPNVTVAGPFMPEDTPTIRAYTFSIPSPDVGLHIGQIIIETGTADRPEIKLPVSVRVLPSWRPEPAGAVLRGDTTQVVMTLFARSDAARAPASIFIESDAAPITAELRWPEGDRTKIPKLVVRSKKSPAGEMTDGATRVNVRDTDGRTLVSVPVAWFATAAQPAKPK